jgi:predicted Holliday junction resolvase-like endonuclease
MNLVGKIFLVLILVMSVLFMAFAMAVYATHKNWREVVLNEQATADKPLGLAKQLKDAKEKNRQLTDEAEKLKQQFDAERAAKTQAVAKLENELKIARDDLAGLEARRDELDMAKREAVAAMYSTQTNATDFRKELEGQRTSVENARKDRDANFKEVVRLTDELNQATNEKDLLKKRTNELAKDLAKAKQVLRKFGLDENKDYSNVPPPVDGLIMATPGGGLIEISIGADSGLMKGHQLEVYRIGGGQNTYVGRVEVVKTAPNKAVCKINPKFQNSHMMVGDRVASKIE